MAAERREILGRHDLGRGRFTIPVDDLDEIERERPLDFGGECRVRPHTVVPMGRNEHFARSHEVVPIHQGVDDRSVLTRLRQLADPQVAHGAIRVDIVARGLGISLGDGQQVLRPK